MLWGLSIRNYTCLLSSPSSNVIVFIISHFSHLVPDSYIPKCVGSKIITGLSFRTVFREVPNLERNHIIYKSRRIGKASMYKLNTDFEAVVLLERFALELSQLPSMKEKTSTTSELDVSDSEITLSKRLNE